MDAITQLTEARCEQLPAVFRALDKRAQQQVLEYAVDRQLLDQARKPRAQRPTATSCRLADFR